ncbi:SIR2 family protein [uncultured Microbacterium sp.]|uniref:SIR2 family protein n=1 Tax=uncultured Microbacterium sp. TaxID=191216 RepID=UPI0025F2ED4D|nr:SIR2 family protein [uncultured Microbacterium sp.]
MSFTSDPVQPRTAVLLGAGSSRDAGLPLTEALAQRIVESFDAEIVALERYEQRQQEPVVRALHMVYGAMVAHATDQGESPLTAVNVEKLVSAIRLLRDRRTHEAAPFVSQWRASIEEVDTHPVPVSDRELSEHVGFDRNLSFKVSGLANDIVTIAKAVTSPGDGTVFAKLEDQILRKICALLEMPDDVSYLEPLIQLAQTQPGGLDITTLNYDRTIELAAEQRGVPVDVGLERWRPGEPLDFPQSDGGINLIKPHGSIDWVRLHSTRQESLPGHPLARYLYVPGRKPSAVARWGTADTPLIVIGDREKLETAGPTLPLIMAFEASLARASNLVVVGYSFGDEHVNTVVRNWLVGDDSRTIVVLDPGWPDTGRMTIGPETELGLRDALRFLAGTPLSGAPGRIVVVRRTARAGLSEALSAKPLGPVPEVLTVEAIWDAPAQLVITNNGYDIENLTISVSKQADGTYAGVTNLRLDVSTQGSDSVVVPALSHGEAVRVYFDPQTTPDGTARAWIHGSSWAHSVSQPLDLQRPTAGR